MAVLALRLSASHTLLLGFISLSHMVPYYCGTPPWSLHVSRLEAETRDALLTREVSQEARRATPPNDGASATMAFQPQPAARWSNVPDAQKVHTRSLLLSL